MGGLYKELYSKLNIINQLKIKMKIIKACLLALTAKSIGAQEECNHDYVDLLELIETTLDFHGKRDICETINNKMFMYNNDGVEVLVDYWVNLCDKSLICDYNYHKESGHSRCVVNE